jgi:hypothetical protein
VDSDSLNSDESIPNVKRKITPLLKNMKKNKTDDHEDTLLGVDLLEGGPPSSKNKLKL